MLLLLTHYKKFSSHSHPHLYLQGEDENRDESAYRKGYSEGLTVASDRKCKWEIMQPRRRRRSANE